MNSDPATHIITRIFELLTDHKSTHSLSSFNPVPPLFIGVQGPQGIGKTTITSSLLATLSTPPHSLKLAVLSLDDFYFPHAGLASIANEHPTNKLLHGRGQPGTHDVPLIEHVLSALAAINTEGPDVQVEVPVFDKSLMGGEGDRLPTGRIISGPVDVVLFEGWCMGFYPLAEEDLRHVYDAIAAPPSSNRNTTATPILPNAVSERDILTSYTIEDILEVNAYLRTYAEGVYPFFQGFVQLAPPQGEPYSRIYIWRLEQEHYMKSLNGGRGMSDDQVKSFIDRYIPGYIFFSAGVQRGYDTSTALDPTNYASAESKLPPWTGQGLRIILDAERKVVRTAFF